MGFTGIEGRKSDVKGADDPKSRGGGERLFERDRQIFKNARKKLAPGPRLLVFNI